MKLKTPVFEAPDHTAAKWYAIILGDFYYWSNHHKQWIRSTNAPGQNERNLQQAMDEKRVHLVVLKGEIS